LRRERGSFFNGGGDIKKEQATTCGGKTNNRTVDMMGDSNQEITTSEETLQS